VIQIPSNNGQHRYTRQTMATNVVYCCNLVVTVDRDSAVCIASRCELGGSGIESGWGTALPHSSRPALGPTQPAVQWVSYHSQW
jgi:hypothetical protein